LFATILHITISLNLLLSNIGMPIFEHICKRQGTTISFYIKSKTCCSKKSKCHIAQARKTQDDYKSKEEFKKQPCCKDLNHFEKNTTPGLKQFSSLAGKHFLFENSSFVTTVFNLGHKFDFYSYTNFQHYHPPPVILAIYKIIEVYRC
jgi:hypothetical protein